MSPRGRLANRMVVSYVLMTLIVAGLFSLTVVVTVDYTEDYYTVQFMRQKLNRLMARIDAGKPVRIDPNESFHIRGADGRPPLPEWLGEITPGFQEAFLDGVEHHVLAEARNGNLYVLVQDPSEFEQRENMIRVIVLLAFLLSLAAAAGLGRAMARRVIAPVTRLASQVQRREQLLAQAPPLAAGYAADEVGTLAAAFDTTFDQLRQALERERFFTSDVSHELRTPLMVIASSCDLLAAQGLPDARQAAQIERIRDACAEMQELVETFLRLARTPDENASERGATLPALAQEQIERFQNAARDRGLDLTLSIEADDAQPYPAPALRAVISNLLRNAIHYTDHGFIHLVVRRGSFSVIDSGIGIPPHRRESMFRAFVRGDVSRGDGIGLGLSLVQRICQRHDWRIQLTSHPAGGCEFRVDLLAA